MKTIIRNYEQLIKDNDYQYDECRIDNEVSEILKVYLNRSFKDFYNMTDFIETFTTSRNFLSSEDMIFKEEKNYRFDGSWNNEVTTILLKNERTSKNIKYFVFDVLEKELKKTNDNEKSLMDLLKENKFNVVNGDTCLQITKVYEKDEKELHQKYEDINYQRRKVS